METRISNTFHRNCSRLFTAALLAVMLLALPARADVAFNTFGPGDSFASFTTTIFGGTPLPPPAAGIRFTVPWTGKLESISVAISSPGPNDKSISIWSDGAGGTTPAGPILLNVPLTGVMPTAGVVTVQTPGGPTLNPGVTYWLLLRQIGGPANYWYPANTPGTWYLQNPFDGVYIPTISTMPAAKIVIDPIGACCSRDLRCVSISRHDCDSFHGQFMGPAVACQPAPCFISLPMGACCRGTTCAVTNAIGCNGVSNSGRFMGADTTCEPVAGVNRCCPADFNGSGVVSVQDLFDYLTVYFANCP